MSDLSASDAHGDLLSGWPYTPPLQGSQHPPVPPTEPVSGRRRRLATVGVAAIALIAGAVGGIAGQLGSSAVRSTSSSAATATAASVGRTSPSFAPGAALSVGDVISRVEPSVVAVDVIYRSSGGGAGPGGWHRDTGTSRTLTCCVPW